MTEYAILMARYNRWMNEKIYAVCETLSDEERELDRKAPFSSIDGLLNHLYLTDSMWLARFGVIEFPIRRVDEPAFDNFADLKAARMERDAQIEAFAVSLTAEKLKGLVHVVSVFHNTSFDLPMLVAVTHFFNHQTHHRGQITTLLEQIGADFGTTDLPMMPDLTV